MKRLLLTHILFALVLTGADAAAPPSAADMQTAQIFKRRFARSVRLDYLLFLPKGYSRKEAKRWPLILFLHGAGERGTNLSLVKVHGPPKLIANQPDFPFILISPQCAEEQVWEPEALLLLLDDVIARHKVDTNRVYLTGLSMGGFGTWTLGARYPERFAAIAPICGGGNTIDVLLSAHHRSEALKSLPVWAFHGAKDPVVPVSESERMIAALKKVGAKDVKLTVYPEAQHDSWTETYANPDLYQWFLQQTRMPMPGKEPKTAKETRSRH